MLLSSNSSTPDTKKGDIDMERRLISLSNKYEWKKMDFNEK